MPDESKNNLNSFISGILLILATLVINSIVSGKNVESDIIKNAASKQDLKFSETNLKAYADKGDMSCVSYINVRMTSEEKLRDTQYTTIIGMLQSILDKENN